MCVCAMFCEIVGSFEQIDHEEEAEEEGAMTEGDGSMSMSMT